MNEQLELNNFLVDQYESKIESLEYDLEQAKEEVRELERRLENAQEAFEDMYNVLDEIHHDANAAYQTPDDNLDFKDKILNDICCEAKSALKRIKI